MPDQESDVSGKIFQTLKDGRPILWTFVPEMPEFDPALLPWLVVVSWKYDGSDHNGMPPAEVNAEMMNFDHALSDLQQPLFCFEAYRRIGYDLREFVLYVADTEEFMSVFNTRLAEHPRYPIDIAFYKDPSWSEFQQLIDDLCPAGNDAKPAIA